MGRRHFRDFRTQRRDHGVRFSIASGRFRRSLCRAVRSVNGFCCNESDGGDVVLGVLCVRKFENGSMTTRLNVSHSTIARHYRGVVRSIIVPCFGECFSTSRCKDCLSFTRGSASISDTPGVSVPDVVTSEVYYRRTTRRDGALGGDGVRSVGGKEVAPH